MDFEYTAEQESFRHKVRAWLDANLPKDLCVDDAQDERVAPNREVFDRRRAWQAQLHSAGYAGLSWPKEYGGHAASLIEQVIWDEEYSRARAPVLPELFRTWPVRSDADELGHRGAEEALPSANPRRRRHLVPGLLGAGRRFRSRGPVHARRRHGRLLSGQRPEGLDLRRAVRGLDVHARAHRPRGAQASRHQLLAAGHEKSRE